MKKNVGVISVVEWRKESALKTFKSIKEQSMKLDELLIVLDGFNHRYDSWVYSLAAKVRQTENQECSYGSWSRYEHSLRYFSPSDILFTFDDDLIYPTKYIMEMMYTYERIKSPISHGGIDSNGIMHHYAHPKREMPLLEISLGIATFSLSSLIGIQNSPVSCFLKHADTETAFGYWWHKNNIVPYLVNTSENVRFVPEAQDPRCLYKTHGSDQGIKHRWTRFRKKLGWPEGTMLPRY